MVRPLHLEGQHIKVAFTFQKEFEEVTTTVCKPCKLVMAAKIQGTFLDHARGVARARASSVERTFSEFRAERNYF